MTDGLDIMYILVRAYITQCFYRFQTSHRTICIHVNVAISIKPQYRVDLPSTEWLSFHLPIPKAHSNVYNDVSRPIQHFLESSLPNSCLRYT
jgi:hypothetical protein